MKRIIQTSFFAGCWLLMVPVCSPAQQSNISYSGTTLKRKIKLHSKEIAINPFDANAFYLRANTKYVLKDYKGALADYNKFIELNPENRMAYYYRAFIKIRLGNKLASRVDFSRASELGLKESADSDFENEPE